MYERYKIVRMFFSKDRSTRTITKGLTLEQAQEHCRDTESSWKTCKSAAKRRYTEKNGPWFDGYEQE